jgi:tRNA A37 threonylcarbamoyladenosine modification protein TsaB
MTILGIDTSSATLKLGLQLQQEIVVREIDQQPRHAQVILPEILGFLSAHGLTLTELSRGLPTVRVQVPSPVLE